MSRIYSHAHAQNKTNNLDLEIVSIKTKVPCSNIKTQERYVRKTGKVET